jgi:hypothetical protein
MKTNQRKLILTRKENTINKQTGAYTAGLEQQQKAD